MPCPTCAPKGLYTGEYEVDQYGLYGPVPSRLWEENQQLPPTSALVQYVPYILILGVLAGTLWWAKKLR